MKKTLPKQSNQLPLKFWVFVNFVQLPLQQLPATNQLLKRAFNLKSVPHKSYQLPTSFEESIQFEISATQKLPATIKFLRLSATSYRWVIKTMVSERLFPKAKATSYHPILKVFLHWINCYTAATSYQLVFEAHIAFWKEDFPGVKATSYHPILKVFFYLEQFLEHQLPLDGRKLQRHKLPATFKFLRSIQICKNVLELLL